MTSPEAALPRRAAGWILVALVVAALARLVAWPHVFTDAGVRFVADGDPCYHVLRAREIAREHRVTFRDPGLNHPVGAEVPWPPLLDLLIAAPAWVAGGAVPAVETVDASAALVPVVLGVLGVLAGALLAGELLGGAAAVAAAFILALSPTHLVYGQVGRPDQHVLETLLLTAELLVCARALRRSRSDAWGAAVALGALLCAAFWTWLGSALHLVVLGVVVAVAHVLFGRGDEPVRRLTRVVARGAAVCGALWALTVLALGPPGALARLSLGGISALPLVLSGAVAAWCALVSGIAARRPASRPPGRAAEAVAAAVVVGALLLAFGPVREALGRGFLAAGRGNAWYAAITEFRPMFLSPYRSVAEQVRDAWLRFGLVPVLATLGLVRLRETWRSQPARRAEVAFAVTLGAVFTALVLHMLRFTYYAAVPLAFFAAAGVGVLADAVASRRGAVLGAVVAVAAMLVALAPTSPQLDPAAWALPQRFAVVEPILSAVRDAGEGGVLAPWDLGHHVRLFSGRPVLASPFGTEGGEGAMEDAAAFFLGEDPSEAEGLLDRRAMRWALVQDPAGDVYTLSLLAEPRTPPVTKVGGPLRGYSFHVEEPYARLLPVRLFYEAGASTPRNPEALGGFRLVADVGPRGGQPMARLFERVSGAGVEVRGARPGAPVEASVEIRTAMGVFRWVSRAAAGSDGRATLRLPYATGRNGAVVASAWVVTDGLRSTAVLPSEEDVRGGSTAVVELSPGAP